jgi:hypothetical protein
MNRSVWARTGIAAAVVLMSAVGHVGVANAAEGDSLSLKIANALRSDRLFMRAGAIHVKVKTKSGDTYDVTGPVITKADLDALTAPSNNDLKNSLLASGVPLATANFLSSNAGLKGSNGLKLIVNQMTDLGIEALGSPPGIKGVAEKSMNTAGFSLGYYLDDDYHWAVEAYVLAAPLSTSVSAAGRPTVRQDPDGISYLRPFGLEGQKIIETKLLPPTVLFGRYWGSKENRFQPYTGAVAMYAIFYKTKATEALNSYVGGSNPGDTTVSLKNAFGVGPSIGFKYNLDDTWHVNFNLSSVKLKTQATIVTRNTLITQKTGAKEDYGLPATLFANDPGGLLAGGSVSDTIETGEITYGIGASSDPAAATARQKLVASLGGVTAIATKAIAYSKGQQDLGTFVRKNETTLNSTIFMLSVGKTF